MSQSNSMSTIITLGIFGAAAYALYEWLSSECATAGSTFYGGSICSALGIHAVAAAPVSTTIPAAALTAPQAQTTATLSNVSAPGQPFQAGDNFALVVSGPPNAPVMGSSSQNGAPVSTTNFGNTNAAGSLTITGSWDASNIGSWQETWQAGSALPAALNFSIGAPGVSGLSANLIPASLIHRGSWA